MLHIIQIPPGKDVQIGQIPLRYTPVKYLPCTDPIPAKHAVNRCEVSRTYWSSRSYINHADHTDPAGHTDAANYTDSANHTDPADHADPPIKNVCIMQIAHTPSRRTDLTYHSGSTRVDHSDPVDHTGPPLVTCRSCRSYRHYFAKDVQIREIEQIPSRSK